MAKKKKEKKASAARTPTRFQPPRTCSPRAPRFPFFLKLPAELRIQIYSHILKFPGAIDADYFWNKPSIDLSLLRACKQINREASHFFYNTNTFCFLEGCDEFQEDHNAIFDHRIYHWMRNLSMANRLSVHRLQLRMRDERPVDYYERLLAYTSGQLPNLTHLGLVMEKHHIGHIRTPSNGHLADWQPNYVIPITEKKMARVAIGLKSFNLNALVVAASRDRIKVLRKFSGLFHQVQVQAIEPQDARRMEFDCRNLLEQKVWYESPGDPYNLKIRQAMRVSGLLDEYFEDGSDMKDKGKNADDGNNEDSD